MTSSDSTIRELFSLNVSVGKKPSDEILSMFFKLTIVQYAPDLSLQGDVG